MNPSPQSSGFWHFSLSFYARDSVAPACLALQDEAGADVNLVLFLFFLAERRLALGDSEIASLDTAVSGWRDDIVVPLRVMRRRMKTGIGRIPAAKAEALRTSIKRIELEAERLEQEALEQCAAGFAPVQAPSENAAAEMSLAAYGRAFSPLPAAPVAALLQAFAARTR